MDSTKKTPATTRRSLLLEATDAPMSRTAHARALSASGRFFFLSKRFKDTRGPAVTWIWITIRISIRILICTEERNAFYLYSERAHLRIITKKSTVYGHTFSKSMDQPGKVVNPARGQLNRENEYSPVPVRA